jgi:hypothetical protein
MTVPYKMEKAWIWGDQHVAICMELLPFLMLATMKEPFLDGCPLQILLEWHS